MAMRLHTTVDLERCWDEVVAHEKAYYGSAGYLEARELVLGDWWKNRCHWWVGLSDGVTGEIRSSASITLLAKGDIDQMLQVSDKGPKSFGSYYKAMANHRREVPVLYVSSIILGERGHAPYIFKAMSREMHQAQQDWAMQFEHFMSIGLHRKSRWMLERYGFKKIGLCRDQFDVFWAERKNAPLLNALLA